jgi:hypothetical protein
MPGQQGAQAEHGPARHNKRRRRPCGGAQVGAQIAVLLAMPEVAQVVPGILDPGGNQGDCREQGQYQTACVGLAQAGEASRRYGGWSIIQAIRYNNALRARKATGPGAGRGQEGDQP